ncbi:M20/M25/M40 family metallo-hydrolase [Chryseobacterium sp. CBSDS_008]|uniref:M20/M25/M40 family metallo-hydrolase n=1 Tax=Chryseobacterium sp. CBSDS_008 TaxID=3415265 RepID=UPI003CFA636A
MKNYSLILSFAVASFIISCKNTEQKTIQNFSVEQLVDKNTTWKHLEEIQKIADNNQNHRSVGSPGGIETANYIESQLNTFGLKPLRLPFETEDREHKKIKGQNIVVEIPGKSKDIIMFGAHYDSVEMGPGINDNATGVAILLEMASVIKKQNIIPEKTIRIAFWDAEEEGVLGSVYYTKHLSESEKKSIKSYINVDMMGTKQPEILVLDGDGSSFQQMREIFKKKGIPAQKIEQLVREMEKSIPKLKAGSAELEKIVETYLKNKNIKYKDDLLTSLSTDTTAFIEICPTTGLGMIHDILQADGKLLFAPCYHQPCDNISNVDKDSFYIGLGLITHLADQLALK